uniref:DNA topoisomerase (ATP-hydrolyzing) n=1 Tax=viral metagenome TaxID=1070528 RepID=A0A6C0IRE1_9ZZZZ
MSNAEELYFDVQQKTDKQHILDNPDTYIGSVENVDTDLWIMNDTSTKIIEKHINYIPGLFKLFDEGIVNCRDHVIRMQTKVSQNVENSIPVTYIDISIQDDGTIVMINDGNGIDVVQHPEYKTWVPELIFGHLRTSTNYNKEEKKIVGGKNGFGFKLVLIWSTFGSVETIDHIRGLKYYQEFKDNLDTICEPKITKASKAKPYTKVVFKPDYKRLGIDGLTPDIIALLKKRVYDISAVTDKSIKVKYNSQVIHTKNFQQYIDLYIGDKTESPRVYEEANERWEYSVALTPTNEFIQVSFVNGIYTSKGGKHVEYILNQITRKLSDYIESKKKVKVNPNSIKEQLILFLRCDIENPAFDSQTKDFMNTPMSKFGSKCDVSDKFIEKIAKMGVMDAALQITEVKENKAAKKTDGTKSKSVKGIPKLTDANFAGTEKSKLCTLIFCEGDSAKTGVISGLSQKDRDTIGVYPLKGKVMNVRGENVKKVSENKEIAEIKKILGLESGKEYQSIEDVHKNLRYSKVVFMTDQDLDGSHIKGLCINLFQNEWSTLTHIPGFIGFMNTPILKAKKGNQELKFYNDGEYEHWKETNDIKGWNIKYYKGLGTSTKTEFIEYFQEKKFVGFEHTGKVSDDTIDMVFNKKRADDRKHWLENVYNRNSFADTGKTMIPYEEFINKELIHFSKYDCDRSIPNIMDGLKISLRKILYCAFKKRLTSEFKVAQFSGYVSEHSCYHHGEESLNKAIVGMAQNFVGSNNINLLFPAGQFGSRIKGGSDASSPRYIFTRLEKITRCIFPEKDDHILNYLSDDGTPVEPQFYVPIIPMVLVNGTKGIGTGFSTEIMCYNPKDIIAYIKNKLLQVTDTIEFVPYYEGFNGTIEKIGEKKYMFKGKYEVIGEDKIKVTELPVGYWTEDFKELLSELENDKDKDGKKIVPVIKQISENFTDTSVDFDIQFSKGKLAELETQQGDNGCNGLEKLLKLTNTSSTTNMNLFDYNDKLQKYESVEDIIDDYYDIRLDYYDIRKEHMISSLEKELLVLSNKAKYISEVLEGTIDLRKKTESEIIAMLSNKDYDTLESDEYEYSYLLKMPMYSVSNEKVQKLLKEYEDKKEELERIKETTIQQMWLYELELLEKEYDTFCDVRKDALLGETNSNSKGKSKNVNKSNKIVVKQSGATKKVTNKTNINPKINLSSNITNIDVEFIEDEVFDFVPIEKKKK